MQPAIQYIAGQPSSVAMAPAMLRDWQEFRPTVRPSHDPDRASAFRGLRQMGGKGNTMTCGNDAGEADGEARNQQPLHGRRQRDGDEGAGRAQQQGVDQQPPVDHVAERQKRQHAQRIAALGHDGGAARLAR